MLECVSTSSSVVILSMTVIWRARIICCAYE